MAQSDHASEWQELAELDPLWAIASAPEKRFGRWEGEAFFATGERDVAPILARARALGRPGRTDSALDFGCGVGRTARALASRFAEVVGVDIAPAMIEQGRELNADVPNLELLVNAGGDLDVLGDRRFDLVFTRVVLQHQPSREAAREYIEAFLRLVNPDGVIAFQLPTYIPRRHRLLVTRRIYVALRRVGVPARFLYERLRLHPIRMLYVPRPMIESWVTAAGGTVLAVDDVRSRRHGVVSSTFYAAPHPERAEQSSS
jgi:SAM-dependent methyltransferase